MTRPEAAALVDESLREMRERMAMAWLCPLDIYGAEWQAIRVLLEGVVMRLAEHAERLREGEP